MHGVCAEASQAEGRHGRCSLERRQRTDADDAQHDRHAVGGVEDSQEQIDELTDRLEQIADSDAACRRIRQIPGIGPIVATAIVAAIGNGAAFRKGRDFAAWLGLVPRQYSTGGKVKLLGISKRGNIYLRKILIHGARAAAMRIKRDRFASEQTLPPHLAATRLLGTTISHEALSCALSF